MIAHSSNKSFNCKQCDYKCLSKASLSRHNGLCHQNDYYECRECNLKFRFANALVTHANFVHNNKKPFTCSVCNSFFSNKSNLTTHRKNHVIKEKNLVIGTTAHR